MQFRGDVLDGEIRALQKRFDGHENMPVYDLFGRDIFDAANEFVEIIRGDVQLVGIECHIVVLGMVSAYQGVEIVEQPPTPVFREIADNADSRALHLVLYGDEQILKIILHRIFRLLYIAMIDEPVGLHEPMPQ